MSSRPKLDPQEAAFVMEEGDRFLQIIVSDGVKYEMDQDIETVIAFFVIRRASGLFDIVNVNRTFSKGKPVSRAVQNKPGIPAGMISEEVDAIRIHFALSIERATGFKLRWHELDLAEVEDQTEQVARIKAWGRVGVKADLPGLGLN